MALFEMSVEIICPPEQVFQFLLKPSNILLISPSGAAMELLDAPEEFTLGSQYEFELGGFGMPQRIIHEIIELDPPRKLTESLVEGPLSKYIHEHIVEEVGSGKSTMIDRIEFEPPGGMIGFLVTEQRILSSFQSAFAHRHREIKKLLEQGNGSA